MNSWQWTSFNSRKKMSVRFELEMQWWVMLLYCCKNLRGRRLSQTLKSVWILIRQFASCFSPNWIENLGSTSEIMFHLIQNLSCLSLLQKIQQRETWRHFGVIRLTLYAASFSLKSSCLHFITLISCLLLPPSLFSFTSRVYMERGVFLPGVLLPLLPNPAGRARIRYLLLLQD